MTFPVTVSVGHHILPVHFLFETLAYFCGYRYYLWLRAGIHDVISDDDRIVIFIGAAAGAFLGSHLLGILEQPRLLRGMNLLYFMGNTTIVGGLLGGLWGVELTKKQIKVNTSSGDLMVFPIILAMIIGRTGCFMAGISDGTFGIPSSLPWAIDFGDGICRHPTNLYEIIFWIILWTMIRTIEKKNQLKNGSRFKLLMVAYLSFRLAIEFIKPDYFFSFGLSVIQLACIAGLIYYIRFLAGLIKKC